MVALRQILVSAALACCATAPAAATAMIGVEPAASGLARPDDGAYLRAAPSDPTSDNLRRTMSQLPDAATWVLLVGGFSLIGLSLRGSHASGMRRVESFGTR